MSLEGLRRALDALDERTHCTGTCRLDEQLAIALPDGDVGALGDPQFVEWLLAHSEVAPFGDGRQTKVDPSVRVTQRLVARGAAQIAGFDPSMVLPEIEAALSPGMHLDAKVIDVLVYPAKGRFARHKDTPRTADLLGTLIVGLPIAHEGGAFQIEDGGATHVIDWSGEPDPRAVRWVALFGDLDHEIKPVLSGSRVTMIYALTLSKRLRKDPSREERIAELTRAIKKVIASDRILPSGGDLMIACTRQVIADREGKQPQGVSVLRGSDRDVAAALEACGLKVSVRSCVVATPNEGAPAARFPEDLQEVARLSRDLSPKFIATMGEAVTFARTGQGDDGDFEATSLARYILDDRTDEWVVRARAAASVIHEAMFARDGYFGNEHYDAYIYTLAAIEVPIASAEQRGIVKPVKPVALARVVHPKFGQGDVIARVSSGADTILEIQFDSGERKKLLERFVKPV